jgi:hypothetical protein
MAEQRFQFQLPGRNQHFDRANLPLHRFGGHSYRLKYLGHDTACAFNSKGSRTQDNFVAMRRAHACGNCNLTASIYHFPFSRGHSSVGRAPALQAGSQGFESPCLQTLKIVSGIDVSLEKFSGQKVPESEICFGNLPKVRAGLA